MKLPQSLRNCWLAALTAGLYFVQLTSAVAQQAPPGSTCATANVFCTGSGAYTFANSTNTPSLGGGGAFDCLGSTPNPVWYYMLVTQSGPIEITLNQTAVNGQGLDVDFVLWGPFPSLTDACSNYSAATVVDCSYSASATEFINVPNAQIGQVYLLLMTNFSGQAGTISFAATGGTGSTGTQPGAISITSNLPVCPGNTGLITATGGVPGNYIWSGPNGVMVQADTLVIPNMQQGSYGSYTVSSGNGVCITSNSINVYPLGAPQASSNSPVCPGNSIQLTADSSASYLGYSWTGPNGFTSNDQHPVIPNATTAHSGIYTVYALLDSCTSPITTIQVDVTSTLNVTATSNGPLNQGATLLLSATGSAGTYTWTGPNGFSQTGHSPYLQNVSPANAGDYTVTVSSVGCVSATSITSVAITPMNQISGMVYNDANNNGTQDAGENPLPNVLITLQPGGYTAITNSQGMYTAFVPDSIYTVAPGGLTLNQTATPASYTVTVTGSAQVAAGNNFGIYSAPVTNVEVTITEEWTAAPGFTTFHRINYKNLGPLPVSGSVKFKRDALLVLTNNTTPGYTVSGDTLIWNYQNLMPGQTAHKYVFMTVPVGTALGTMLHSTAYVTPFASDIAQQNNTYTLTQEVTGSWDPNDKAVQPMGAITPQQVASGQDLMYTIRFQNTGTAPAVNVLVIDTLSSNLDLSTFRMIASSHNYQLTMHSNGVAEWRFPNIMLPDSNSNEPASHGDIMFSIKAKQSLVVGDNIYNTAHIFFDFNEAVVTNTTHTPVSMPLAAPDLTDTELSVFPNPTTGSFTLLMNNAQQGPVQIRVMNMLGQILAEETATSATSRFEHRVELHQAPSGIYLLQIQQGGKSYTKRVMVQD